MLCYMKQITAHSYGSWLTGPKQENVRQLEGHIDDQYSVGAEQYLLNLNPQSGKLSFAMPKAARLVQCSPDPRAEKSAKTAADPMHGPQLIFHVMTTI